MKKGLFLDLDGTLIDSNYKISKKNKEAIKKAINEGWKIYIATGKSFVEAIKFADELKLDTPLITSQGQVIIKLPFEVVKFITQDFFYIDKILNSDNIKAILKNWTIETVDSLWTKKIKDNETLNLFRNTIKKVFEYNSKTNKRDLVNSAILGVYFDIEKLDEKKLLKLMNKLNKEFPSKEFQYWYTDNNFTTVTINPKHINKWSAIECLIECEKLDFIASMGNGWSDREMIKNSDIGIAMKNSRQKVKDVANWISKYDNDKDGVAYEIYKLLEVTKDK